MARPSTVRRVHGAVMRLAERGGPAALTMEGIAAEAGVGKQTLYRAWPSVHAVLFDALAGDPTETEESRAPGGSIVDVLAEAVAEISTEPRESLLRALAAQIQTDDDVARQFQDRLLLPQRSVIAGLVEEAGNARPEQAAELLLAPIVYRWFLRLEPMSAEELGDHAARVLGPGR